MKSWGGAANVKYTTEVPQNFKIYKLSLYFTEISLNNAFPHGRIIILFVNEQKYVYTLQSDLYFDHKSNITCDENKNTTVQIKFMFYCGYEIQLPKIQKYHCTTTVLSINPEICDKRVCIWFI